MCTRVASRAISSDTPASCSDRTSRSEGVVRVTASRLRRVGWPVAIGAILVAQFCLAYRSASRTSVTVDEVAYVPAGVSYWMTGDWRMSRDHPILMKYILGALPACVRPELPRGEAWDGQDQWVFGHAFVRANADRLQHLLILARLPVLLLGCGTSLLALLWATQLYGRGAGLAAGVMCAFCPNLLAHSQLATLDVGLTFFVVATLYAFSQTGRARGPYRTLGWGALTGLALAGACLVKYSALLVALVLVPVAIVHVICPDGRGGGQADTDPPRRRSRWALLGAYGLIPLVTLVVLNGIYGFHGTSRSLAVYKTESVTMTRLASGPLGRLPVPLPARYVSGLDTQLAHGVGGQGIYLNGRLRRQGAWYYFLEALALKTPVGYQLVLLLGLAGLFWFRPHAWRDELLLLGMVGSYLAVMSVCNLQLGIRYVLPILPPVWVLASSAARMPGCRRAGAVVVVGALVLGVGDHLRHYPHSLSYFNQYAGGPANGHHYLADSNIDWGQDLIRLRNYLRQKNIRHVYMAYFGRVNPEVYGIWWHPVPPRPVRGVYVVSTNFVAGVGYLSEWGGQIFKIGKKHSKGIWYIRRFGSSGAPPSEYPINWLMERTPDDRVGYSLFVYRIESHGP